MPPARLAPRPHDIVEIKCLSAKDIDKAASLLQSVYGADARLDRLDPTAEFGMDLVSAAFGEVRLTEVKISNWSMTRTTGEFAHIALPLDGALNYQSGAGLFVAEPGRRAAVGRPFETVNLKVSKGKGLELYAPIDGLIERAELLTGKSYDRSLIDHMADRIDLSYPVGEALARTMKSAMLDMTGLRSIGLGSLALSGYEELLLNIATAALFPQVAADYGHAPQECGSSVIRRARDHIEAHAAEVIELGALAKKLGVSMRAMQLGFQHYFGYSPRDFIIECRLEGAHKKLLAGESTSSVTAIALDCGFGDLSHFSAKYRDKYGKAPSETLRGAMK
jgi:AraC-like DNA-binding protein